MDETAFGSVYCPVCARHVGKMSVAWWSNLSVEKKQAECEDCHPSGWLIEIKE